MSSDHDAPVRAGYDGPARTGGPQPSRQIADLVSLMAALRAPGTGCPWDLEQNFSTIAPYTIEEAYEVADAIQRGDLDDLRDELGDLLLQVVFHARLAQETGAFDFGDVVEAITAKLIRRHPHVFGEIRHLSSVQVKALWDDIKRDEKAQRAARRGGTQGPERPSALDGVPAQPALGRADKLARRAAAVGFTWSRPEEVLVKLEEELAELRVALQGGREVEIRDEFGDVVFTLANLGRLVGVDPEHALAGANAKFERRFRAIEAALSQDGRTPQNSDLEEMDRLWNEAKAAERP